MPWNMPNTFNPYTPQPFNQNQFYRQTPQQHTILRVDGENGAHSMQMAPNSEALALDNNAPIVWVLRTDGAGYLSVTPFDISPHQNVPPVDVNSLEQRIARLEGIVNGKSNSESVEQSATK